MRARGGERKQREERDWAGVEAENSQLGTGRGGGEEEVIGESRDGVGGGGGGERQGGEVREMREERGEGEWGGIVRGEVEREGGFGRAVEAEPPFGDEGDVGGGGGGGGGGRWWEAVEDFF